MFKLMKVFDSCRPIKDKMPQDVYNVSHTLNNELWNNGNDSYYPFDIVERPTGEEEGIGWITDAEAKLLTDWLRAQGAEVGETVLIKHWW